MQTVRTLAKGQIVIPAPIRKRLAISQGSLLGIKLVGDHIELRPMPDDPIAAFSGSLVKGRSLSEGLVAEHKREVLRDGKG